MRTPEHYEACALALVNKLDEVDPLTRTAANDVGALLAGAQVFATLAMAAATNQMYAGPGDDSATVAESREEPT